MSCGEGRVDDIKTGGASGEIGLCGWGGAIHLPKRDLTGGRILQQDVGIAAAGDVANLSHAPAGGDRGEGGFGHSAPG
jgi:hypothetical protein